jgi:hypothetical protein
LTLLSIIQGAARELPVSAPTTVIGNAETNVVTLLQLANKEVLELLRQYDWQALMAEGHFTTVAAETQTTLAAAATDADIFRICNDTMWDRTQAMKVFGPLTPEEWARKKANPAQASASYWFRMRGNSILFYPNPPAGNSIYFEYLRGTAILDANGTTRKAAWAADTDTCILNEELVRLGVVWRFLQGRKLDYAEEFRTYEDARDHFASIDGAKPVIDMSGEVESLTVTVPEGSWVL